MTQHYQLGCSGCGRSIEVGPAQAGETLICACGHSVAVPTLRELRRMEPVVERAASAGPVNRWSLPRGILFVTGAVLLVLGIYNHFQLAPQRAHLVTTAPAFPELNFDVQGLTLTQAWQAWEYFRQQTLEDRPTPPHLENRDRHRELGFYLYAAWAVAAVGGALIISSLLGGRRVGSRKGEERGSASARG